MIVFSALSTVLAVATAELPAQASCTDFNSRIAEALTITQEQITGEKLGGTPLGQGRYQVGELTYYDDGVVIRSHDPRFAGLRIASGARPWHICGRNVHGPGRYRLGSEWRKLGFSRQVVPQHEVARGAGQAAELGAFPMLEGHLPGAAWPFDSFFIGLMHPQSGAEETAVVLFDRKSGPQPVKVIARLPMKLTTVSALPALHEPWVGLSLASVDADGAWRMVDFSIQDETLRRLSDELAAH